MEVCLPKAVKTTKDGSQRLLMLTLKKTIAYLVRFGGDWLWILVVVSCEN